MITGTINIDYLKSYFATPEDMATLTGIDYTRCMKFFHLPSFVGSGYDFQKLLKAGVNLNELLKEQEFNIKTYNG